MTVMQECPGSVISIISYRLDRISELMKTRLGSQFHFLISKICLLLITSTCLSNHLKKGSVLWTISSNGTSTVKICSDYHIIRLSRLWIKWNQSEWLSCQVRIATINLQSENASEIRINNQFPRIRGNIWRAEILNDGSVTIIPNFFLYVTIFRSIWGCKTSVLGCSWCRNDGAPCRR